MRRKALQKADELNRIMDVFVAGLCIVISLLIALVTLPLLM